MLGIIDVIVTILMIPLIFFYGTKYPNYTQVDYLELGLIVLIVVLECGLYLFKAIVFRHRKSLPIIQDGDLVEFVYDPTMLIIYGEGIEITEPDKISRIWRHDGDNFNLIFARPIRELDNEWRRKDWRNSTRDGKGTMWLL